MTQQPHENALDAFDLDFDTSSVTDGLPDGYNDIRREDPLEEFDTSSATDGLVDLEHGSDDDLFPPMEAIMQSVGDAAVTDVAREASSRSTEASSAASDDADGPEGQDGSDDADDADEDEVPALSMNNSKDELQAAARELGLDDSGSKQELLDRINGK